MLLSGPPSALIFFEPQIEVNPIIDNAPTELNRRNSLLLKQRDANSQVVRRLLLGKATAGWQSERRLIHVLLAITCSTVFFPVPRLN